MTTAETKYLFAAIQAIRVGRATSHLRVIGAGPLSAVRELVSIARKKNINLIMDEFTMLHSSNPPRIEVPTSANYMSLARYCTEYPDYVVEMPLRGASLRQYVVESGNGQKYTVNSVIRNGVESLFSTLERAYEWALAAS